MTVCKCTTYEKERGHLDCCSLYVEMKNLRYKFRAWVKDKRFGQEMFDIIMITFPVGREVLLSGKGGSVNASDCELMQSTGHKDVNGKEIYEGDIVRFNGIVSVIRYELSAYYARFHPEWREVDNHGVFEDEMGPKFAWFELQVIGNIYENAELVKI